MKSVGGSALLNDQSKMLYTVYIFSNQAFTFRTVSNFSVEAALHGTDTDDGGEAEDDSEVLSQDDSVQGSACEEEDSLP